MDTGAGFVVVAMAAVLLLAGLGIGIAYLLTLQRAIERCAPQNRALSPGQVWLNLIPLFNIVWQFILVDRIATTLTREFAARGAPPPPGKYGRNVGLAMCVLGAVSFIPYLGILTSVASVVCWIVYWVKVSDYSRALVQVGATAAENGSGPVPAYASLQPEAGAQWAILLVLALGYGASYFQRIALSVNASSVMRDLHLTAPQTGLIFSAFLWGMMAGYVLMTALTVLCGARWGLIASFTGVSLAAWGSGLFPGYGGLLAARFLLGLFSAGLLPGAVQSARDWFPARARTFVVGAVMAAGYLAAILAPLMSGVVHMGWRSVLIVAGLPSLVSAILCLLVWPKSPAHEPFPGVSTAAFASTGMIALGFLFASPGIAFFANWLPTYQLSHGPSFLKNSIGGFAFQMESLCGPLLAGFIAWATMSGVARPSRSRAVLLTVFGSLLLLAVLGAGGERSVAVAEVFWGLGYPAWAALLYSAVADAMPARGVAVGAAIGGLMLAIGGMLGTPAIGMIEQMYGYGTVVFAVGSVTLIGVASVLLLAWGVRQKSAGDSAAIAAA